MFGTYASPGSAPFCCLFFLPDCVHLYRVSYLMVLSLVHLRTLVLCSSLCSAHVLLFICDLSVFTCIVLFINSLHNYSSIQIRFDVHQRVGGLGWGHFLLFVSTSVIFKKIIKLQKYNMLQRCWISNNNVMNYFTFFITAVVFSCVLHVPIKIPMRMQIRNSRTVSFLSSSIFINPTPPTPNTPTAWKSCGHRKGLLKHF